MWPWGWASWGTSREPMGLYNQMETDRDLPEVAAGESVGETTGWLIVVGGGGVARSRVPARKGVGDIPSVSLFIQPIPTIPRALYSAAAVCDPKIG